MKKNKKGFLLAETIIVSSVVITALIVIYMQFIKVDNSYYKSFNYNNVNDLYLANQFKNFIFDNDKNKLFNSINTENLYLDVTSCDSTYFTEYVYCSNLINAIDAKKIIIIKNSITDLININNYDLSDNLKTFIQNIKSNDEGYRLIIEFNDNKIASLKLN